MKTTPLELIALGMRLATKDSDKLPDDVFSGELSAMFTGDADRRKEALRDFLAGLDVTWDGGPVIDSVSTWVKYLRDISESKAYLRRVRLELERDEMTLTYPNIAGTYNLSEKIRELKDRSR